MQRQLAHGYRGYESDENVRLYPGTQPDVRILGQRKPKTYTCRFDKGTQKVGRGGENEPEACWLSM